VITVTNYTGRTWNRSNGDGLLLYAGDDDPIATMRLKAIRDGLEDYEYLWLLQYKVNRIEADPSLEPYSGWLTKANAALAVKPEVAKSLIDFDRTTTGYNLEIARQEIATLLTEASAVTYSALSSGLMAHWKMDKTLPITTSDGEGADAFVRGGSYVNSNYGSNGYLTVKQAGSANYHRSAYLRFDISKLNFTGTSATLTLKRYSGTITPTTVRVYALNDGSSYGSGQLDESWAEGSIKAANAPGGDGNTGINSSYTTYLGNLSWNGDTASLTFTNMDFINNDTNGKVTLILYKNDTVNEDLNFASKEHATLAAPTLTIHNNSVRDSVGGHDGTLHGSGSWVSGRLNSALRLPSSTSVVTVPHSTDLNPGGSNFTISAWVKTTDGAGIIVYKDRVGSSHDRYYLHITGGKAQFVFDSGGSTSTLTLTNPATINDGQWHHIAAVRTGVKTGALYVDGGTPVTGAYSGSLGGVDTNGTLYIGRNSSGSHQLNSTIDDVRFYKRALSADNVAALSLSEMKGHWQLNETGGTTATDSAKGHNGTLQGSGTSWISGRLANALKLINTTSVTAAVSVPHTTDLNPGGSSFTLSAWVKTTDGEGIIVYKGRNGTTHDRYYLQITGGKPQFVFDSGDTASTLTLTGLAMINDGQWHHISAVRTGLKTGALYVDGATPVTGTHNGQWAGVDTNGTFYIGRDSGTANYLNGTIDDVRYYKRAISLDEAAALAQPEP
ncbi:MAG: DNRLRE domain-containing protein, partial [Phycisphaerae bacterium]|nr:DNRLRE domain-containing protein [Phycisphaerae bacterium]